MLDNSSSGKQSQVDFLIVGAGLSGINMARHIETALPKKTVLVVDKRGSIGGTWDLFTYPGVRSDSDMFTLAYPSIPWRSTDAIVSGASILDYVRNAAESLSTPIRTGVRVLSANWDSEEAAWEVTLASAEGVETVCRCTFLLLCSGFYDHDEPNAVELPGIDMFRGDVLAPQRWPANYSLENKRVVVVGSGATAITLVPELAKKARHVHMVQRSPTYVLSMPRVDPTADILTKFGLSTDRTFRIVRSVNTHTASAFYWFCRAFPRLARYVLVRMMYAQLQSGFDPLAFRPRYRPWDQRLCVTPDGELFRAISAGSVSVATGDIRTVTPTGLIMADGQTISADTVVMATGLRFVAYGGVPLTIDGRPLRLSERFAYDGFMLEGVPNAAWCAGYTNASWTLRADLVARKVVRLSRELDRRRKTVATPTVCKPMNARALMALNAGYIERARGDMPIAGNRRPWKVYRSVIADRFAHRFVRASKDVKFS